MTSQWCCQVGKIVAVFALALCSNHVWAQDLVLPVFQSGKTYELPSGDYILPDSVVLTGLKNVTIRGQKQTRIICKDVNKDVMRIESCRAITVENILLVHENPKKEYECHGSVFSLSDSKNVTIRDCDINGCGAIGVRVSNCEKVNIINNTITNNSFNAFYLSNSRAIKIRANIVHTNKNLLQLHKVDNLMMSDNIISGNGGYWQDKAVEIGRKK